MRRSTYHPFRVCSNVRTAQQFNCCSSMNESRHWINQLRGHDRRLRQSHVQCTWDRDIDAIGADRCYYEMSILLLGMFNCWQCSTMQTMQTMFVMCVRSTECTECTCWTRPTTWSRFCVCMCDTVAQFYGFGLKIEWWSPQTTYRNNNMVHQARKRNAMSIRLQCARRRMANSPNDRDD